MEQLRDNMMYNFNQNINKAENINHQIIGNKKQM